MSFLDTKVDLSSTVYTAADLEFGREYLVGVFGLVDPKWLVYPVGYLWQWWLRDDREAVCYLIHFALVLSTLEQKGLSPESREIFHKKVGLLLRRIRAKSAFEEAFTELEVAAYLAKTYPILLEPRILELENAKKPQLQPVTGSKVIDIAVPLEKQILFVEVTVFHFEAFDDWLATVRQLSNLIAQVFWLEKVSRRVKISLPFPLSLKPALSNRDVQVILDNLVNLPEGNLTLATEENQTITLVWADEKEITNPANELVFKFGEITCALTAETRVIFEDSLLKSLRNSLRVKRVQCRDDLSPLLVIKPASPDLPPSLVMDLIERRVWNNRRFAWVSGIGLFTPPNAFKNSHQPPQLKISLNPNAKRLLSPTILTELEKLEPNK
jgi:hypothetical protein